MGMLFGESNMSKGLVLVIIYGFCHETTEKNKIEEIKRTLPKSLRQLDKTLTPLGLFKDKDIVIKCPSENQSSDREFAVVIYGSGLDPFHETADLRKKLKEAVTRPLSGLYPFDRDNPTVVELFIVTGSAQIG